jgi:transposase
VVLTPGSRNDGTQLEAVLDAIRVPRTGCWPIGATARGSTGGCSGRAIPHTIPERSDHRERRAKRPGRPLGFEADLYARRNVVERCVNRLKQWSGIATRYEKRAPNYRAMVVITSLMIWLTA